MKCLKCDTEMIQIEKNVGLTFRRTSFECNRCKIYAHVIYEDKDSSKIIKKINYSEWGY